MPKNNESTMKWKVDIGQLTKAMQDAKRAISVANAEFKTATAGMDRWQKSTDGLEAKIKQLNDTLPQQKKILADLERQYELTAENMGENSKQAHDLQIKIEGQRATIVKTETNINKYNQQLQDMNAAQEKSNTASGKLTKTIQEQQDKLDDLKGEYKDAVLLYGENSEEAQSLAKEIKDLSSDLAKNKEQMEQADKAADELDKSLKDTGDSAEDASEGFTVMKGALADLVAKGISLAVEGLKNMASAAYDAWNAYDDGADTIITATGATGEAAEDLMKVYDKVADNVLDDFGNIGNAIGEVNTRFGLTGSELEKTSEKFIKFAKLNGVDVKTAVDNVQSSMAAFGIETDKVSDVLDVFNKAGQDTGVSVDGLASSVKTNSSALQEMGFNLSDSVMFLANLDKSGVDTASTLAGLKKALANAAKEGKPMSDALDGIEKAIKNANTETEAITKATELFGSKAGASIAKAVRSGRLSFKEFGTTLDDFRGNIETTYDAILDVPDDIALSIQRLRKTAANTVDSFFQNHGAKINKYVNEFTDKAIPKIEKTAGKLFDFIDNHGQTVVDTLKAIATAFVTYKAVTTITSVVDAFKGLHTAIKSGKTIMEAFNLTLAANPIALVAAGIAGLIALAVNHEKALQKEAEAQYGLNAAQKESVNSAKELADSYAAIDAARQDQVDQITAEYGYIEQLKDEYNGLIDSNGKVKDGYEDRANFILNQLSKALGMEVEDIKKVIEANGKLGDSIDDLIRKKQAEATLAANESAYNEAIKNRSKALDTLTSAQKALDETEKAYTKTKTEADAVMEKYNELLGESWEAAGAYFQANKQIIEGNTIAKKSYEEAKAAVEEAESAWIGYNTTIQNYEGLSAAIISGDAAKINDALLDMQYNFITAETGNRESLERQVQNYQTNLENLQAAIRNGTPNVTKDMVDQAKSMVDAANAELDKLPPEASAKGEKAGSEFGSSMGRQKDIVARKAEELANQAEFSVTPAVDKLDVKGAKAGAAFGAAVGSQANKETAKSSGEKLADEAVKGADSESGEKGGATTSGSNFGKGFFNGIGSWIKSVWQRGKELAASALGGVKEGQKEGSPSKLTRRSGEFFGEGYALGIEDMIKPVATAATDLAKTAVDALGSNISAEMRVIGEEGGNSLIDGMNSVLPDMTGSIGTLKANVAAANASMTAASGTGVGNFTAGGQQIQNITFNQYNDSPKALDRLSIYRQTNNLLFSAKVGLQNV